MTPTPIILSAEEAQSAFIGIAQRACAEGFVSGLFDWAFETEGLALRGRAHVKGRPLKLPSGYTGLEWTLMVWMASDPDPGLAGRQSTLVSFDSLASNATSRHRVWSNPERLWGCSHDQSQDPGAPSTSIPQASPLDEISDWSGAVWRHTLARAIVDLTTCPRVASRVIAEALPPSPSSDGRRSLSL